VKDKIVSIASRVLALEGRTSIERLAFVMRRSEPRGQSAGQAGRPAHRQEEREESPGAYAGTKEPEGRDSCMP